MKLTWLLPTLVAMAGYTRVEAGGLCTVKAYQFQWRGQFAGFIVNGYFSYNAQAVPSNGIVREEDLLRLDVTFYDPKGVKLRTYTDNHESSDTVNFAFDHLSREILQNGNFDQEDDEVRRRNGFMMGEGDPTHHKENGVESGLAFWSRAADDKTTHLLVDDWNDDNGDGQFGYPDGFHIHEDASFPYFTTQARIETGKVGTAYYNVDVNGTMITNNLASDVGSVGQLIRVTPVTPDKIDRKICKQRMKNLLG